MDNIDINQRIKDIKPGKVVFRIIIGVFVLMFVSSAFGTIGAGERGVLLQFGAVKDKVFDEGLYFKIPFIQQVQKMDVKILKDEVPASAASKDLQVVTSIIALELSFSPRVGKQSLAGIREKLQYPHYSSIHSRIGQSNNREIYRRRAYHQERRGERANQNKPSGKIV